MILTVGVHMTTKTTVKLSATLTATTGIVAMRKFADLLVPFIAQGRADAQSL